MNEKGERRGRRRTVEEGGPFLARGSREGGDEGADPVGDGLGRGGRVEGKVVDVVRGLGNLER